MSTKMQKSNSSWTPANSNVQGETFDPARPFPNTDKPPQFNSLQLQPEEGENQFGSFVYNRTPPIRAKMQGVKTSTGNQNSAVQTTPITSRPSIIQRFCDECSQKEQNSQELLAKPHQKSFAQPKLTMGTPSDKYEQEGNLLERQVLQDINFTESADLKSSHLQRKTQEITFEEGITISGDEVISDIPTENQDIDNFISAIQNHLQALIDLHQTAFTNFGRQVQDKDLGSSDANIVGAVLKKGIEIGTQKLVEIIGKRVPFLGEAVDIVKAMKDEVDRAKDAATEDAMDDFINSVSSSVVQKLVNEKATIESKKNSLKAAIKRRLAEVGSPDSPDRISWLVENVVHKYQALNDQRPSIGDIELGMVQQWLQSIRGTEYGGWGTWQSKGHLFFYYKVDEEEGTYNLVEKCLAGGEYATPLLEVLQKDVFKNQVNVSMEQLSLPSVVRIKSDQNRMKDYSFRLGPGSIKGGDDPWHMFSRFIGHLPRQINIRTLKAENKVFI